MFSRILNSLKSLYSSATSRFQKKEIQETIKITKEAEKQYKRQKDISEKTIRNLTVKKESWTRSANKRYNSQMNKPVLKENDRERYFHYHLKNSGEVVPSKSLKTFFDNIKSRFLSILRDGYKVIPCLSVTLMKVNVDKKEIMEYHMKKPPHHIIDGEDKKRFWKSLFPFFSTQLKESMLEGSGWTLVSIDELGVKMYKIPIETGGSRTPLPHIFKDYHCILSNPNRDEECLKWALNKLAFPKGDLSFLDFSNMSFPASQKDLKRFERDNPDYLIFCFQYEDDEMFVFYRDPKYFDLQKEKIVLNLLLYNSHFFPITDIDLFLQRGYNQRNRIWHCRSCFVIFHTEEKYENHLPYCKTDYVTKITFPEEGSVKKFRFFSSALYHPIVLYFDCESILNPLYIEKGKGTVLYQKHEFSCLGLYEVNDITGKHKYKDFETLEEFLEYLETLTRFLKSHSNKKLNPKTVPTIIPDSCAFCECPFSETPRVHHCHFTGNFIQFLCNQCNILMKKRKVIPMVAHNGMGYDAKLIFRIFKDYDIRVIAKNLENFISFSVKMNGVEIIFQDSYKFLNSSLDSLSKNLLTKGKSFFHHTLSKMGTNDIFFQKGFFPYDYITSDIVLEDTTLPSIKEFYSVLKEEGITKENYETAKEFWTLTKCNTLRDYQKNYLKLDCLLLADIFENFRKSIFSMYKLDPIHFYTLASLSYSCCLKFTNQELELISDPLMYNFIEAGIRGGECFIGKKISTANNKYMKTFDPTQKSKFIIYLDANNLYGNSMVQSLPVGDFQWGNPEQWELYEDCIVSCDISLPSHLKDYFKDYPLFPEQYEGKLCGTFFPKTHYVVHSKYLKYGISLGYRLDKVNSVLLFRSEPWLKPYIEKNTHLRSQATDDFEKDLWKLMNNIIYGKQIENKRNRINIKHVNNDMEKEVRKRSFKDILFLEENSYLIELHKKIQRLDTPHYGGQVILDLSKLHMAQFFYGYLKPKFPNLTLLMTDTDSFVLEIETEDFYKEIEKDIPSYFDTSNFPENFGIPRINKKVLGKFKDEMGGNIITTFIGPAPKQYFLECENGDITKKSKGLTKQSMKDISKEDYVNAIHGEIRETTINIIRSHKQELYSESVEKIALSTRDTKRKILEDGIHTVPWGY